MARTVRTGAGIGARVDGHGKKVVCQLVGEDGNAFSIISRARRAFREAGVDAAVIDAYMAEATSGNYDHMLTATIDHLTRAGIDVR